MTFTLLRTKHIPAMQAEVQEYEHAASGARHIHLATDNPEMVFLVAFPTVPDSNDGRAHVLEHLALCGSARYPVRDPFFAMMRRSTSHFMNAMTYADKTVYPFATTGKTDFFNLLDVYLDATFFPRLDALDFLQEGWRLVLEGDTLTYQGIVLNEMKGAFADPIRAIRTGINAKLLRGTTYAFQSGGDPLAIPTLTCEALRQFHSSHYHPSQAVFMTAGALAARHVQEAIEERVLTHLPGRMPRLMPQLAAAWTSPEQATIEAPVREHGVQIAWLLGESADQNVYYEAALLDSGLLGNASAPLMRAMESAGFGRPSALNGYDASARQLVFHLGMEGLSEVHVDKARRCIWSALEQAAEQGVPPAALNAALRNRRFRQREISGGSSPHALRQLLRAMPHAMYGSDIMNGFDCDAVLGEFQKKAADPAFFKGLVRNLLDCTTRLDLDVVPDAAYFSRRKQIEEDRLAAILEKLTDDDRERLRAESAALQKRQCSVVDNDVLPRIRPQDIDPLPRPAMRLPESSTGVLAVPIASNGISYARVMYDVSAMTPEDWPWLQLYAAIAPETGIGARAYDEADAWRHDCAPFFDVNLYCAQRQDEQRSLLIHVDFYAKGLREEGGAIATLLSESIRATRFDEIERLRFLIDSRMKDLRKDLAERGNEYARYAAAAPLSPLRRVDESIKGTGWLAFFRELHRQAQTAEGIASISRRLAELHRRIVGCPSLVFTAGTGQDAGDLAALTALPPATAVPPAPGDACAPQSPTPASVALHAPSQVNHCVAAWAGPTYGHPDAPVLAVLGELLTNLVLHRALREEGGAYGGYASYSDAAGIFLMKSYRDPGLAATYEVFEQAVEWVMEAPLQQENIEEAIVCVMQALDKPRTPYGELTWAWDQERQGITEDMRRRFRAGVLNCSAARLKQAAATWLHGKTPSRAAFVGDLEQDLAGLEPLSLAELAC